MPLVECMENSVKFLEQRAEENQNLVMLSKIRNIRIWKATITCPSFRPSGYADYSQASLWTRSPLSGKSGEGL